MWPPLLVLGVVAHIGGLPTKADLQTPVGVDNVVDGEFLITWLDGDLDPTGMFYFFYQVHNVTPTALAKDPEFVGVPVTDLETYIMDPANQLVWDTSAVPAGSYFIYAITEDPPLAGLYSMSQGVVTVRHPGDPLWPAVVVLEPDGEADTASSVFTFTWQASGEGPLSADVRVRRPGTEEPYVTIASDLPMTDAGDGTVTGSYDWDVTAELEGFYYAEVIVRDGGGRSHAAFSRRTMSIRHLPDAGVPDAGPPGGPDAASPPVTCDDCGGCRTAGGGGVAPAWSLGLVLALMLRRRSRRQRR